MSATEEVYGGLSWVGRTQAKIFFILIIVFFVFVTALILFQLFSSLRILRNKNNYSATQITDAKQRLSKTLATLLITSIIFGILIFVSYLNLKETEQSKQYAAATGLLDVISDIQGGLKV